MRSSYELRVLRTFGSRPFGCDDWLYIPSNKEICFEISHGKAVLLGRKSSSGTGSILGQVLSSSLDVWDLCHLWVRVPRILG